MHIRNSCSILACVPYALMRANKLRLLLSREEERRFELFEGLGVSAVEIVFVEAS